MEADKDSRRRRGAAYVTSNACNECKRKKAKCDGQTPCSKCAAVGNTNCRYEISVRASKTALKADNDELRAYRQSSEYIFGLLASGEQCDFVLGELKKGKSPEGIVQGLKQQLPLDSLMGNIAARAPVELGSLIESPMHLPHESSVSQIRGKDVAIEHDLQNLGPWTAVTTDGALIEHLMSLYFCWEYPIFASLSRQHFLADFRSGRHRYCSPLLVNTILAVGYQFSSDSIRNSNGTVSANDFANETERLLEFEQDIPSLTTVQALGILSILEASQGRSEQSAFHCGQAIRMAVEMGLHLDVGVPQLSGTEHEVRRATVWGAFTLEHTWSLILGRIPHLSRKGFRAAKPTVFEMEEKIEWFPYTGQKELHNNTQHQESNIRSVYVALCDLFEVVHNSLYVLYTPGKALRSHEILDIYTSYLAWHSSLPLVLRQGQNSTPPAFFIHIYYNFAILLLFGPFIRTRIISWEFMLLQLCVQAATTIGSLLISYGQLYTVRRTPCFLPIIALASDIMLVAQAEIQGTPNLQLFPGISTLQEMAYAHTFAIRGVKFLRALEQRTNLAMPSDGATRSIDRAGLYQHVRGSLCFVEAGIENLPPSQADPFYTSIFAPFPSQVLPTPSFIRELRTCGFEMVNIPM